MTIREDLKDVIKQHSQLTLSICPLQAKNSSVDAHANCCNIVVLLNKREAAVNVRGKVNSGNVYFEEEATTVWTVDVHHVLLIQKQKANTNHVGNAQHRL
jgi:hypothetical protein